MCFIRAACAPCHDSSTRAAIETSPDERGRQRAGARARARCLGANRSRSQVRVYLVNPAGDEAAAAAAGADSYITVAAGPELTVKAFKEGVSRARPPAARWPPQCPLPWRGCRSETHTPLRVLLTCRACDAEVPLRRFLTGFARSAS